MESGSCDLVGYSGDLFMAFSADFQIVEGGIATFRTAHSRLSLRGIGTRGNGPGASLVRSMKILSHRKKEKSKAPAKKTWCGSWRWIIFFVASNQGPRCDD